MLANLLQDVRYSLHGFARRPMFAAVVVLTLALAIGVNVAVFSLYEQIMLRELPVSRPGELVNVVSPGPRPVNVYCGQQGSCDETFSYPLFRDLEAAGKPVVGLAASRIIAVALGREGGTTRAPAMLVSDGYFATLGINPALGRLLAPQDFVDPRPSTVVLSFDYWATAFGADPSVIGKPLMVSGRALEIVGVAPRGFVGTTPSETPAVFAPITVEWYRDSQRATPLNEDRLVSYLYVFGRLKPGVTRQEAERRLDAAFRTIITKVEAPLVAADSELDMAAFRSRTLTLAPGARGQNQPAQLARTPLATFAAVGVVVLLIACTNLANLLFARGAARTSEISVRAALGAARSRLYGLLAVEALLLASAAAVVSLPVALTVVRLVEWLEPPAVAVQSAGLDWRAAAVAFAIAGIAAVSFALAPALKLVGTAPARALHGQGLRAFGSRALGRFRFALATAQLALSMLFLVLAALFAQSLANVARIELGLRTDSVATFFVSPTLNGYPPERGRQLLEAVEQELAAHAGVTGVATSAVTLLSGQQWYSRVALAGFDSALAAERRVNVNEVSSGFFEALDVPLLAGRGFSPVDTLDAPKVAVVNESFARQFGLRDDIVGRRLTAEPGGPADVEIVGLVRDAAYDAVKAPLAAQVILPREQSGNFGLGANYYVRTERELEPLLAAIPRIVASVDPTLAVMELRAFESVARNNVRTDRMLLALAATLAAVATLLAVVGVFGVLSYMVTQRHREIGLRLALGAEPAGVRWLVLKQVASMAAVGLPLGLGAALLVGELARSLLFGTAPADPRAVLAALAVLITALVAASFWPARSAARVDPAVALRAE